MNSRLPTLAALAALAILAPCIARAQEQDSSPVDVSLILAGGTDYVWRGLSQTDGDPAAFASVTVTKGGFYAGAGTENVDFSGIKQEYDFWGGYVFDLGAAKLDLGLSFYGYFDAPENIDTLEMKASLSGASGKLGYSATGYFTFDYFGTNGNALYTEIAASYPIADRMLLSATLGHQQIDRLPDYTTWNLGVSYDVWKNGRLDLRYHDMGTDFYGDPGRGRVVGTLTWTL